MISLFKQIYLKNNSIIAYCLTMLEREVIQSNYDRLKTKKYLLKFERDFDNMEAVNKYMDSLREGGDVLIVYREYPKTIPRPHLGKRFFDLIFFQINLEIAAPYLKKIIEEQELKISVINSVFEKKPSWFKKIFSRK